ncbi:citrate lyase subunit alpha [Campylobacter sp. 2018MI13]|uniref:citrate lyase subunit alpha n=1 Tax=Campylobacter sp. 2018MI13 TaxID=2836737 RepID=UPI001BD99B68|nr:citrate lyase subunit alpha [Campylobacter sp. 2018MI13]MBT0882403.1 citrate lyase subunit alpha [Campylobacter sp. 2018MI13]
MYKVNAVNRKIPNKIANYKDVVVYSGELKQPKERKIGAAIRVGKKEDKLVSSIKDAIIKSGLKDGMTISFHHHFRSGDYILNLVLEEISKLGIKNLCVAASSLSTCHKPLIEHIKNGVVTSLQTSGLREPLGSFISNGGLKTPVIIRSHGGRARAIEDGSLKIDVAFIGAPSCDKFGNLNGYTGKSACGSLGYAKVDAMYANKVIAITDNLVDGINLPASIDQTMVDFVCEIESIGDPKGIVSGAIRFNDNPRDILIAENALKCILASGLFKNGFSFQTGAAGASLAVTKLLKEEMIKHNITASLGVGGITAALVDLHENGLMDALFDTQSFDLDAVSSLAKNPKHYEISASFYANPNLVTPAVNQLDFVMLGALEIDTNFNVNVITTSTGVINQAIGGHQDTAEGAKIAMILAPLIRARIPIVVDNVSTICTPGANVDVVCTDYGIAVNPKRTDLIENFTKAGIKLYTIEELKEMAEKITGKPASIKFSDEVVGVVEYRDGSVLDVIYKSLQN